MDLSDSLHDATGTRAALELRVLSGRQAGARALLPSDGAWTSLGHLADNDLVLREAPFELAEISLQDGQWTWRQGSMDPQPLRAGQGVRYGEFMLLLCSPSQPWTPEPPQGWAIDGQAEDGPSLVAPGGAAPADGAHGLESVEAKTEAGESTEDDAASALNARPDPALYEPAGLASPEIDRMDAEPSTASSPAARGAVGSLVGRLVAVAAGIMVMLAALWAFNPSGGELGREVAPAAPGAQAESAALAPVLAPVAAVGEEDLKALQAMLAQQPELSRGLQASLGPEGKVTLQGVVANDEALENVLRPAIRAGLRLTLQVLTVREFELRAQALKSLLPPGITARGMADGRVVLEGELRQEAALDSLPAAVAQEIPEALSVELAVLTPAMRHEMHEAAQFNAAARKAAVPPMKPLPEVVSVIGGTDSYIVLADGLRVAPGGEAGAWRVSSIGAGQVTFIDALGRSRTLKP